MSVYQAEVEFKGGCYNCPFCTETKRKCVFTGVEVIWKFRAKPGFPVNELGVPLADTVFDPYKKRLKECPLTKVQK